ncbi:uncharacterized protein BJX67DRAFT_383053 [Aspergillus lucknowensis]|uniref:Zn(2)-C6 fungal-type domain-containing protein n=1 Tax=Aspergillus lucknowensis TaxID=176173 RepID=A0ABR4LL97_9EURO
MENGMTLMELTPETLGGQPMKKKRRPAFACQECRRRKIRCDRQTPCGQCSKANVPSCSYVCDSRITPTTAPFEAHDTRFSVLQQSVGFPLPSDFSTGSLGLETSRTPSVTSVHSPGGAGNIGPATSSSGDVQSMLPSHLLGWNEPADVGASDMALDLALIHGGDPPLSPPFPGGSKSRIQGMFSRSRYLGPGHWKNFAQPSAVVQSVMNMLEARARQDNNTTLAKCKSAAKKVKSQRLAFIPAMGSRRDLLPERSVADRLLQTYLRTTQSVLGVVSVPSFYRRYVDIWSSSTPSDANFEVLLLLVLAIGWAASSQELAVSRSTVLQWIDVARTWLGSPMYKKRRVLDSIRVHCLFTLACQFLAIPEDQSCFGTATLVRTAMLMGLHIDPTRCAFEEQPSTLEIQSRRRLWATILELELQSCLDHGLVPCVGVDDYDTELPLNVDDAALDSPSPRTTSGEGGAFALLGQDLSQLTSCSLQLLLAQTIAVRLRIVRFLNSFRPAEQPFEQALKLSADLSSLMKLASDRIEAYRISCSPPPTSFQTQFFDQLLQRTMLALHHPFAARAIKDQSLYYSRKICFEATLSLLSRSVFPGDAEFYQLRVASGSLFPAAYTQCALFLCAELVDQSDIGVPSPVNPRTGYVRREMQAAVQRFLDLFLQKIRSGTETNVQLYATIHGMLAHADAIEAGMSASRTETRVRDAVNDSLDTVHGILSRRGGQSTHSHSVDPQPNWMDIPDVLATDQGFWPPS